VESNSGGRSFARAVERRLRESGNTTICIRWFTQTANKMSRIQTNSTAVTNCVIWPSGWKDRWPNVYSELRSASRTRRMIHDDIEDAITGVIEKCLTSFSVW
jgi:predicted phage terminase large subunit-like protein